ncbi:hypothetical protein SDC9_89514 [bioreactor metagenome]|uniref:Uncharacterized protein n=1 Tax=bioreactor metagenome TaxID=1076179 RepID=A0A644ZPR7_9ZZZZ
MAPDTVFHYGSVTLCPWPYYLGLCPKGKDCGMVKSILSLECVTPDDIVLRDMAIVAGGPWLVGTLLPGLVIGGHDVAVNACRGVVGEVGGHTRHIEQVKEEPAQDTQQYYGGYYELTGKDFLHRL